MTTPWEVFDEAYRRWLTQSGITEENLGPVDRVGLRKMYLSTGEAQLLESLTKIDCQCALLGQEFLLRPRNVSLRHYVDAAKACIDKDDVKQLLHQLMNVHQKHEEGAAMPFSVIVASSGTGKTQLAATASLRMNVRYLLCDPVRDDHTQPFYVPHVELSNLLMKCIQHFRSEYKNDLEYRNGAIAYADLFKAKEITCPLSCLLDKILFPARTDEKSSGSVGFQTLMRKVDEQNSLSGSTEEGLLVFLDETPELRMKLFHDVMMLRDLFRAIGICPVLMSTHSGSQNSVYTGTHSSQSELNPFWCRMFLRLPRYQKSAVEDSNKYILTTERPLVAYLMSLLKGSHDLLDTVREVQLSLQTKKRVAWTGNPVFQLCQLFRTKKAEGDTNACTHNLVGKHFGFLSIPGKEDEMFADLTREDAHSRSKCMFRVRMVEPDKEPILFLALVCWKYDDLRSENNTRMFPLVDSQRRAISVRRAFNASSDDFRTNVFKSNPVASSLDGDDLETTALASVCLASMNVDSGIFSEVPLPEFLASISHFMQENELSAEALKETTKQISSTLTLNDTVMQEIAGMTIPKCSPSDAPFPQSLEIEHSIARLTRPENKEKRDRRMDKGDGKTPLVVFECKNYANGVDKKTFKGIVQRFDVNYKVAVLFASSLNNFFANDGAWNQTMEELNLREDSICFLVLQGSKVQWLQVEKGCNGRNAGRTLGPTRDTQRLFVVILTGQVCAIAQE